MKLEISIAASRPLKQEVLDGLAPLIAEQHVEDTACRHDNVGFACTFTAVTQSPDHLLEEIGAVLTRIEKLHGISGAIDLQVRNSDCSEPVLGMLPHGKPFSPVAGIRIMPWHDVEKLPPQSSDIFLDPSRAFGTGLHPSTRLCLQILQLAAGLGSAKNFASRSVLDIGCGSGILSIAALRLGAARAVGIEICPEAVSAARRNIILNRLGEKVRITESSWQEITGTTHDLILANLVPSVLFKAASAIAGLLSENGLLITAGFPGTKNDAVSSLFAESGLHLLHNASADGWGALLLGNRQIT